MTEERQRQVRAVNAFSALDNLVYWLISVKMKYFMARIHR